MPLPTSVERKTAVASRNPKGEKSAPPILNDSGDRFSLICGGGVAVAVEAVAEEVLAAELATVPLAAEELPELGAAAGLAAAGAVGTAVEAEEAAEDVWAADACLFVPLARVVALFVLLLSEGFEAVPSVCATADAANRITAKKLSKILFIHSSLKVSIPRGHTFRLEESQHSIQFSVSRAVRCPRSLR
jgi:hypothetical protein